MAAYDQFIRGELNQLSAEDLNPEAHRHLICRMILRMTNHRFKVLLQSQLSFSQNLISAVPERTRTKRAQKSSKFELSDVITTRLRNE